MSAAREETARLAGQWPEWRIWTTAHEMYVCAVRRQAPPEGWFEHGLSMTLIEDSVPELATALEDEALLEATLTSGTVSAP